MEIIVLQHIKIEDPGYIKDLMLKDGVNLTTIELDEGEKIPDDLTEFDAMFNFLEDKNLFAFWQDENNKKKSKDKLNSFSKVSVLRKESR